MNEKIYISTIIGKDYQQWTNENIIINSDTNTGKTTFICDVLIPWARDNNKSVLYLVNRKTLESQLKLRLSDFDNVTISKYHNLSSLYEREYGIGHYDYIVCDECHYFRCDSTFNHTTDFALKYIKSFNDCVKIWMSATAGDFFKSLPDCKRYSIENKYEHIDAIYFYQEKQLPEIIKRILQVNQEDKILVFVNSIKRLQEMFYIFGNEASYMCSRSNKKAKSLPFIEYDLISGCTFDKRILFTTKAMDNGIDIKDDRVRHVISEIFDVDSAIQAIGRKRPISSEDDYKVYFRHYSGKTVNIYKQGALKQLEPIRMFIKDRQVFCETYQHNKQLLKWNNAFYGDVDFSQDGIGEIKINQVYVDKLMDDLSDYRQMEISSYDDVIVGRLGLFYKVRNLEIETENKDAFLTYLKSLISVKLFKTEQEELKNAFRSMLGLKSRNMGINTLNGNLKDCGYSFEIVSKRETQGECKFKRYWTVKSTVG